MGYGHLGSLILRDFAPRPVPRLLSQICPRQLPGGEVGGNSPHLLGNIEKGKSEKKSLATE